MTHWQWEQLTDLYRCEFGEYCVCTMLSESFRCLFYRVPMCTPCTFRPSFLSIQVMFQNPQRDPKGTLTSTPFVMNLHEN